MSSNPPIFDKVDCVLTTFTERLKRSTRSIMPNIPFTQPHDDAVSEMRIRRVLFLLERANIAMMHCEKEKSLVLRACN